MKNLFFVLIITLFFAGCSMGPDYTRPPLEVPEIKLSQADLSIPDSVAQELIDSNWWEFFGDTVLTALIDSAVANNYDIKIATARIEQFMGSYSVTQSDYYPKINAGALGQTGESNSKGVKYRDNRFNVNLSATWEIDLWGKVRRANEAALADVLGAEESKRGVVLTIVSQVAQTYIDILSLDYQIIIAEQTVDVRQKSLDLFNQRKAKGDISDLEISQLESEYWFAKAQIPLLERNRSQLETALSILLGKGPISIPRGRNLDELILPEIPAVIPSQLLERRPDIRTAEEQLIAANARIGIVKSLYFPSISLTGLLGFSNTDFSNLFKSSSFVWNAGGNLVAPLFRAGEISGQVDEAEAIQRQLLFNYLQVVNAAFGDAQNSLIARNQNEVKFTADGKRLDAVSQYRLLSQMRYDEGVTSYLEVLDAERSLFSSQLDYVKSKADLLKSSVSIYSALAGGWLDAKIDQSNQTGNDEEN